MFTKVFRSMYDGTLASRGPWQALVTFQQMLILADRRGVVDMTPEAIARISTIPIDIIRAGIEALEQPDPGSRTRDENGKRIIRLDPARDWGWRIVNYEKYRQIRNEEDRREYQRKWMADKRKIVNRRQMLTKSTHAEADADAEIPESYSVDPSSVPDISHSVEPLQVDSAQKRAVGGAEAIQILDVFNHWVQVWDHQQAKLDPKRRRKIQLALAAGYSVEQLKQAIDGYRNSPHHRGDNDRSTVYSELTLFLRDAAHIDAGLAFLKPVEAPLSDLTRHNAAVLSTWRPPEENHATGRSTAIPGSHGSHGGGIRQIAFAATDDDLLGGGEGSGDRGTGNGGEDRDQASPAFSPTGRTA